MSIPFFIEREKMDLKQLLIGLKLLNKNINDLANSIINKTYDNSNGIQIIEGIKKILPMWINLENVIEQDTRESIVWVIQDFLDAYENNDEILMVDSIMFGIRPKCEQDIVILDEALK